MRSRSLARPAARPNALAVLAGAALALLLAASDVAEPGARHRAPEAGAGVEAAAPEPLLAASRRLVLMAIGTAGLASQRDRRPRGR